MGTSPPASESVIRQLEKMSSSQTFSGSERSSKLLQFIVKQTISGNSDQLKEYTLGSKPLGRGDNFDPRTDPIVRAEASRLRSRLALYYGTEGQADLLVISLPKGSYVPVFEARVALNPAVEKPAAVRVGPWKLAAAVLGLALLIISLWAWRSTRPAAGALTRLEVELRTEGSLGSEVGTDVVISPDGTRLAFVARDTNAVPHLYTLRLDEQKVNQLDGTDGARAQFFSPDGQWIAFWAQSKLKKVPAGGGPPIFLCDASDLLGGSWGDDGNILALLDSTGKLWRVPSDGGKPVLILDAAPAHVGWPQVLPGSAAVLFSSSLAGAETSEILSLKDGKRKTIARGGTYARYLPDGYLTYVNGGTLFAVAFDPVRQETNGAPVAILDDVAYSPTFGYAQLAFSQNGRVVYQRSSNQRSIEWLDSSGRTEPLLTQPARYSRPRLSPNGLRVAYSIGDVAGFSSWIFDAVAKKTTRLAVGDGSYAAPVWTPDGRFLVFQGLHGMGWVAADEATHVESLLKTSAIQSPWSFTPDGKLLAYFEFGPSTGIDLWTVPIETVAGKLSAGHPEPFLNTDAAECYPAFSPDGHWLAYSSDESGSWEVYVRPFPAKVPKVQVSNGGGRVPFWSPSGRELYYATDRQRIMRTSYTIRDGAFLPAQPGAWTDRRIAETGVIAGLDLAPDGKRFAVLLPAETPDQQQSPNHVTMLFNFFDEVQHRVNSAR